MEPMGFEDETRPWLGIACAVVLVFLSAGQIFAAPVEHGNIPMALSATVCVPPGMPPFAEWTGSLANPTIVQDEMGRPVIAIERLYTHRGAKFTTIWVGSVLVSVDPAPEDPTAPGWHDRGAVTVPATMLRERPVQACDWFKPLPLPRPLEGPST